MFQVPEDDRFFWRRVLAEDGEWLLRVRCNGRLAVDDLDVLDCDRG